MSDTNVDHSEVDKFAQLASRWWDEGGEFKPLHALNPTRMAFIEQYVDLTGTRVLDIGCGGGILSESLAAAGASVTACDASEAVIQVAKLHLQESGHNIDYRVATCEAIAATKPAPFDVITCMELLEHVPCPEQLIQTVADLLAPGGHAFVSTINRTVNAYLGAIIGAEYILRLLPKGTHDYQRFIRPAELSQWLRDAGLSVANISGMRYNPITHTTQLCDNVSINYLMHITKS